MQKHETKGVAGGATGEVVENKGASLQGWSVRGTEAGKWRETKFGEVRRGWRLRITHKITMNT
jgi:hypothetical protein